MKVQLIVVQGKPEGKVIPLVQSPFRIGRGETCHLRPNSEQVSREHAEFTMSADSVHVRDLGSRNGTLVNGKAVTDIYTLKDRDLVTVGHLTFAVSIQGVVPAKPVSPPPATAAPAASGAAKPKSTSALDDVSGDEIDSWLVADSANATPERPSGVYGGDTITIAAFRDATAAAPKPTTPPAPAPAPAAAAPPEDDEEFERLPGGNGDDDDEREDDDEASDEAEEAAASLDDMPEDFIDESNPFYVKKKAPEPEAAPSKPVYKDTSDAAQDILRKMFERRKASKES